MENRYAVRFIRPVFETLEIQVDASSEDEALINATRRLTHKKESEWRGRFEPESYGISVQYIIPVADLEGDEEAYFGSCTKFMLLRADTDAGEGSVSVQPWMSSSNDLMTADLCSDWKAQLAKLEEGLYEFRNFLQTIKGVKIIPFPIKQFAGKKS